MRLNVDVTLLHRFARFLLVGGIATLCQFAILVVLVEGIGMVPKSASTIGFLVSSAANYCLNRTFTFRSEVSHRVAVPRFAVTATAGLVLNYLLMFALNEELRIQYVVSQIVATAVCLFWNFFVNQFWSFNSQWK